MELFDHALAKWCHGGGLLVEGTTLRPAPPSAPHLGTRPWLTSAQTIVLPPTMSFYGPTSESIVNRGPGAKTGPNRGWRSRHRAPVRMIHTTASTKFRSPILEGYPRPASRGSSGTMASHAESDSVWRSIGSVDQKSDPPAMPVCTDLRTGPKASGESAHQRPTPRHGTDSVDLPPANRGRGAVHRHASARLIRPSTRRAPSSRARTREGVRLDGERGVLESPLVRAGSLARRPLGLIFDSSWPTADAERRSNAGLRGRVS